MANVSWNARDEQGRMIEVTSETVMDVAPPGPEAIAAGGSLAVNHYGPFTITHETTELTTNGHKIADIPANSIVQAWVIGKIAAIGSGITSAVVQIWLGNQATFQGIPITTAEALDSPSTNSWNDGQVWGEFPNPDTLDANTGYTLLAPQVGYTALARELYVWADVRDGTLENLLADIYWMVATPQAS